MKLERSKDWWMARARREGDAAVSTGLLAFDPAPEELLVIEDDVHYVPELRTVFKLAQTFEVSQQRLMQLAGLATANDVGLRQEAVRFAARSESVQKLTPEESSALEVFVAVLSEQEPKRVK